MSDLPVPERRRGAMLSYALNRWETLAVIFIAMVGVAGAIAFFEASIAIITGCVVFAVVGVAAMVVVSFRDATSVDEALTEVDLSAIHDGTLRKKVERAQTYQRAIRRAIRQVKSPELRSSLEVITREMTDPIDLVHTLCRRLEAYQGDQILRQDYQRLTANRASLSEPERQQLATLEKLRRLMGDVSSAVDGAVAQLGASYSAVQLARSSGELHGAQSSEVLDSLRAQSSQLRDLNASLDEIYGESLRGGS